MEKDKYAPFHPALRAATKKVEEYYDKTADSNAHIIAMCAYSLCSFNGCVRVLMCDSVIHPGKKMNYFKENWDEGLQRDIQVLAEKVVR